MAKVMHPDKGGSEEKMAAVNEAYEVLSNPGMRRVSLFFSFNPSLTGYITFSELRQRFDNGDDPNDPTAQSGGHPFQQGGGHPFMQFFQGGNGGFSQGQGFSYHFRSGGGQGRGGPF